MDLGAKLATIENIRGLIATCLLLVGVLFSPSISRANHINCLIPQVNVDQVPIDTACAFPQNLIDPITRGPFSVGRIDYNLNVNFRFDSFRALTPGVPGSCGRVGDNDRATLKASILYPGNPTDTENGDEPEIEEKAPIAAGDTRFPLVVFVHGAGFKPDSFDFALRRIVSTGVIAVSLSGFNDEGITGPDGVPSDDTQAFVECRAHLILMHLRFINRLAFEDAVGVASNLGTQFTDRIDMTRIGLIGWSRGGEGVVTAALKQKGGSVPFGPFAIRGLVSIAPSRNHRSTATGTIALDIPWFGLVGTSDSQIVHTVDIFEKLKGLGTKSLAVVPGSDHFWGATERDRSLATTLVSAFVQLNVVGNTSAGLREILKGNAVDDSIRGRDIRWSSRNGEHLPFETFEEEPADENDTGGSNSASTGAENDSEISLGPADPIGGDLSLYSGRALSFDWASGSAEYLFKAGQQDFTMFAGSRSMLAVRLGRRDVSPTSSQISIGMRDTCGHEHFVTARPLSARFASSTIIETRNVPISCFDHNIDMRSLKEVIVKIRNPSSGSIIVKSITLRQ